MQAVHRTFEITLGRRGADELLPELERSEDVLSITVLRDASVKPRGDVIVAHVLNRGANHVLESIGALKDQRALSIVVSEVGAIVDPAHDAIVARDADEAIWEEAESDVHHQGQLTQNFLVLMTLGGAVGAVGLVLESTAQAIALVSASIIAPGFEVVTRIPLGLVLRRWGLVRGGLSGLLAGYGALVVGAALAFAILLAVGAADERAYAGNPKVHQLISPAAPDFLLTSCAAIAGVTMVLAYRRVQLAGPLIALALIPAAALVGAALVTARGDLMLEGLERLLLDVVLVIGWGALVVQAKQWLVHRRSPLA
jgi:hypothetical protein